jgi:uncharacterized spore protein YtfJ
VSASIRRRRLGKKEARMKVDDLLEGARDAITVRRVYGEPIELDGVTVVPAAAVRGGGGGGGDDSDNGGGGFGLAARPVGAWVIRGDGYVSWRPAVDVTRLAAIAALVLLGAIRPLRG